MKYVDYQFMLAIARANYWNTLIASGGYKLNKTQRASGKNDDGTFAWRDCTDEEKLEDALATAQRHIEFAQKCADHIGESQEDK